MTALAKRNWHWRILFIMLLLFLGLPWVLWAIAMYAEVDSTMPLVVPMLLWVSIPASLIGPPLFRAVQFGYNPIGFGAWMLVVLFWVGIAAAVWLLFCAISSLRAKRHI